MERRTIGALQEGLAGGLARAGHVSGLAEVDLARQHRAARRESSSWPNGPKLRDGRAEERKVIRAFRAGLVHCGASAGMPIRSWNRSVPFGFSADLPHEQSW